MQTVVITGATSGIGLATTKKFLQNGWQVMLVARNATKGAQVVADLAKDFDEKLIGFVAADVSKEQTLRKWLSQLWNASAALTP